MSQLFVDNIKNRTGGAVGFPTGVVVTGVATFNNQVSIAGTLTYEDVTNVDSTGIITAKSGLQLGSAGAGGTFTSAGYGQLEGGLVVSGVTTSTTLAVTGVATASSSVIAGIVTTNADGIVATGVITATSFVGTLTGSATTIAGAPNVTLGNVNAGVVTATGGSFTGDVDIADKIVHTGDTNTAIRFPAADTFTVETAGSERFRIHPSGISHFKAGLAEKVNVKSQLTSANACAITDGNVILTTSAEPGNTYPDITGVHSVLSSGEGFSVTIALKVDGSGTINGFRIDGVAQTIEWSGGSAPSAGSDGYDVFTFSAFKTGSGTTDYKVFGAATNYT